jgi:hypothetical protein
MVQTLLDLKQAQMSGQEVRDKISASPAFRDVLERLSNYFLKYKISGCANCYFDTYVKLMLIKMENIKENTCEFELKAGVLLQDVNGQFNLVTRHNLTTEKALYHLKKHPQKIEKFSKYPKNYLELVEQFDLISLTLKAKRKESAQEVEKKAEIVQETEQKEVVEVKKPAVVVNKTQPRKKNRGGK